MAISHKPGAVVSDCGISISDVASAIEAGEFALADSHVQHMSGASAETQRLLREAIPELLAQVRSSRRELAKKLRRQGQTRQANRAYRA